MALVRGLPHRHRHQFGPVGAGPADTAGPPRCAAMVETVGDRTRVMFLCTPNNPTGPALTHDEVQWVLDNVPEHLLVVVDEAYRYVQDPAAVRAWK